MSRDTKDLLRSIDNRLKSLLRLKAEETLEEDATNREKVKTLYELGLDNSEMADIIGTTPASIRGTVSHLRSDGEIN